MPDWSTILYKVAPHANASVVKAIVPHMDMLNEFAVTSPLRQAHFLAQAAHESDGFRTLREYGSEAYFAKYEGRKDLGNVLLGDGFRFRGRGIFQITGRANYATYGRKIGIDLIKEPDAASDGVNAVRIACLFWRDHGLNELADADNLRGITKRINGGLNGFAERKAYLTRAKAALKP